MSHSSLLRLAESPHWTLHTALEYLAIYWDNIGLTHYIVRRLHEQRLDEVKDFWGIIWYALSAAAATVLTSVLAISSLANRLRAPHSRILYSSYQKSPRI